MRSLTIRLPDVLGKRLEQESRARRVSKSHIVRERLDQPELAPLKEGGMREILQAAWGAKVPSLPRRFRSPHKRRLAELIRVRKLPR